MVSVIKHPDVRRPKRWKVCYRDIHKHRKSHFFTSRSEAEVYAEIRRREIQNCGLQALSLPDDARREAAQALELLKPYDKGILEAAKHYVG